MLHGAIFLATCNAILLLRDVKLPNTSLYYTPLMFSQHIERKATILALIRKRNIVFTKVCVKFLIFNLEAFNFRYNISFIDPPLGGFGEILPSVMIFPSGQSPSGNIITSGNISPNPPRSRSINDKCSLLIDFASVTSVLASFQVFFFIQ